jgi:hypothetical protein
MESEAFEFSDDDLEALLDGQGTGGDAALRRFILDLRRDVELLDETPSPQLARWIADNSRRRRSDAPAHTRVVELNEIIESLASLGVTIARCDPDRAECGSQRGTE